MNEDLESELLSAYHDGEVTPMERAEVERLLADEERAQYEVDELRDLSTTLSSTSGEGAPAGLYEAVMRRIEQESLIPGSPSESERRPDGREPDSSSAAWVSVAAGVTTLAAGLLVAFQLTKDPNPPAGPDIVTHATAPGIESDRGVVGAPSGEVAEANVAAAEVADEVELRAKPLGIRGGETVAGEEGRIADATARPGPVPFANPPAMGDAPAADPVATTEGESVPDESGVSRARRFGLTFDDDLEGAEVGDVVRALENHGDEVAVVRLTVVDRRQGIEALQLLLARHDVDRDFADLDVETSKRREEVEGGGAGLEAVFVEATPDQLASTIEEMRSIASFRSLEVEEPVAFAQLDDFRGRAMAMARLDERQPRAAPAFASADGRRRAELKSEQPTPTGAKSVPTEEPAATVEPAAAVEPTAAGAVPPPRLAKKAEQDRGPKELGDSVERNALVERLEADHADDAEPRRNAPTKPGDSKARVRSRQRSLVVPPSLFARSTAEKLDGAESPVDEPVAESPLEKEPVEVAQERIDRKGRAFVGRASIRDETARRKRATDRSLPVLFVIVLAEDVTPASPAREREPVGEPQPASDSPEGA